MQSVLNVIAVRAANPCWWGHDVLSVCLAPWQFSCWNADSNPDSDHQAMLRVTADDPLFADALFLAGKMISGTLPNITGGADSYYAESIPAPNWVPSARYTTRIAGQRFYITRAGEHAPSPAPAAPVPAPKPAPTPLVPDITADQLMQMELSGDAAAFAAEMQSTQTN
jgi:hypothetical protein